MCVCECFFQECSVWVRSRSSQVSVIFTKKKYSAFHSIKTTDPKSPNTKCNFFFTFYGLKILGDLGLEKSVVASVVWVSFNDWLLLIGSNVVKFFFCGGCGYYDKKSMQLFLWTLYNISYSLSFSIFQGGFGNGWFVLGRLSIVFFLKMF